MSRHNGKSDEAHGNRQQNLPNGKQKGEPIVVDGSNIAWEAQTKNGQPKVDNILAVIQALEAEGYDPVVVVDASLRHDIDDPQRLESLIDSQKIIQAPAGTDADYFVLETAAQDNSKVVTNDRYRDWQGQFPWIENRRVPVMFVDGRAELYKPSLEGK